MEGSDLMPGQHTEYAFETAIQHHLTTAGGYVTGDRDGFDPHRAVFPADVLAFIKATQPDEWAYLEGIQKSRAEETLLDDLCRALDSEHRAALISATVTGKIDVRGEVA
jgi:type I restriction enzyme R subunit